MTIGYESILFLLAWYSITTTLFTAILSPVFLNDCIVFFGAGGKEKTGRRTLTKSAQKHGKNGQKSLTKNAETYINVRVQCKGPSGRLCPQV